VLPEDVTGEELDEEAREELRGLPKDLALLVAKYLVVAGNLLDEDPEEAYRHAKTARRLASRVGVVREACGLAAYNAGEWADALSELRAARRLPGRESAYLPIMADCERGLGRPERALDLAKSKEAEHLEQGDRVELKMVESGARRDLGQFEAAVVTLQIPELKDRKLKPWSPRLYYAYADALFEAGREDEAREWFARSAAADKDDETDAAERYAELDGLEIIDAAAEDDDAVDTEFDVHFEGPMTTRPRPAEPVPDADPEPVIEPESAIELVVEPEAELVVETVTVVEPETELVVEPVVVEEPAVAEPVAVDEPAEPATAGVEQPVFTAPEAPEPVVQTGRGAVEQPLFKAAEEPEPVVKNGLEAVERPLFKAPEAPQDEE
jgi:tetratricopeptide (TPR) repeat protein